MHVLLVIHLSIFCHAFAVFLLLLRVLKDIIELQVPHVNRTDYQLIDISEDGFVSYFFLIVLSM